MRKIIILSSLLLGTTLLTGCGKKQARQNQPTEPVITNPAQNNTGVVPPGTQLSQPSVDTSWETYINKTAGYQLTFPDTWKGYRADNSGITVTDINFGAWGPNTYYLFDLVEEPRAIYKQTIKDTGEIYVGEQNSNSKNVILCGGACCKGGSGIPQYNDFEKARCAEVPSILKTFQAIE